jgi:recombination protein RecT
MTQQLVQALATHSKSIKSVLPSSMQTDEKLKRIQRIALTVCENDSYLQKCDPLTVLGCVVKAASYGLEVEPSFGHAYLVPYKGKCTLIIGYRGMMELVRRSGKVSHISARIVYENDFFEIEYGAEEKIIHKPFLKGDRGEMVGVYAVATLKDNGEHQFEYLSKEQVDKIKNSAQTDMVWSKHYEEMARKTAVRRLYKYLPMSTDDAQEAISLDDTPETQQPHLLIDPNHRLAEPESDKTVYEQVQESASQDLDKRREDVAMVLCELSLEHGEEKVKKVLDIGEQFKIENASDSDLKKIALKLKSAKFNE